MRVIASYDTHMRVLVLKIEWPCYVHGANTKMINCVILLFHLAYFILI